MNEQPLLAVIVTCYNLEQYVDRCVASIVAQLYQNLEILLIDDGSTDQTGQRCDAWQGKDQRIRVIHKNNEGLSYARKTGIENATAEYVTFVDVDDWISPDMYSDMMSALLSTHSDIAQCGFCEVFEGTDPPILQRKKDNIEILSHEEGVFLILEAKKWLSVLWNKIFKKHLFDHVEFKKDLNLGEDWIAHILFHHASQSVYLADEYYFYYRRFYGMMNSLSNSMKTVKAHYQFTQEVYDRYLFVEQHQQYHRLLRYIKEITVFRGILCLRDMVTFGSCDEWFENLARKVRSIPLPVNCDFSFVDFEDHISPSEFKFHFFMLKIHPKCFKISRKIYSKCFKIIRKIVNLVKRLIRLVIPKKKR